MIEIEQLFSEIKSIIAEHEQNARLTGANFNIFEVLGVETKEVKLHSALLAELLNVQGSHAQVSKYLDLFIEQLELDDMCFDTKSSKTFVEYYISEIDNETKEGGNIDILIRDKGNRYIIIENKIHAPDQENQLKRYHNFLKKQHKDSRLFYLNLFGKKPETESVVDLKDEDYHIITYQSDILQWLERCLKESVNMPAIREIIQQYINVIKKITNQKNNPMNNDIVKLATNSSKNIEAVSRIAECFDDVKQKILNNFWETLCSSLKEKGLPVKKENDDIIKKYYKARKNVDEKIIRLCWIEIPEIKIKDYQLCWGAKIEHNFYTYFGFYKSEDKFLSFKEEEEANKIMGFLNERRYPNKEIGSVWKYSNPQLNFKEFNSQDIFALANSDELKKVVNNIVAEVSEDIEAVKDLWNKMRNPKDS